MCYLRTYAKEATVLTEELDKLNIKKKEKLDEFNDERESLKKAANEKVT